MEYFTEAYRLVIDNANGLGIDSVIQQKLREYKKSFLSLVRHFTDNIYENCNILGSSREPFRRSLKIIRVL